MQVGTVAEWVTASVTFVATLAAILAGLLAYKEYRRGSLAERREDASHVHAWVAKDLQTNEKVIVLRNGGESPIYAVRVRVIWNNEELIAPHEERDRSWNVIPPGTYQVLRDPKYIWAFPEPCDGSARFRPYARSEADIVTGVLFTDARGVRWSRNRHGRLREVQAKKE